MTKVLSVGIGIVDRGRVDSEEDLKLRPAININPPPKDGRCMCCKRHISELKPFGKAGDPLLEDFDGAYLVRTARPVGPCDEEAESAMKEAERCYRDEGFESTWFWMINKYGEDRAKELYFKDKAHVSGAKSWECRDCIALNEDEYFTKLGERGITIDPQDYIAIPQFKRRPIEELLEIVYQRKNAY